MKVLVCGYERSGTIAVGVLLAKGCGLSILNDPPSSYAANLAVLSGEGLPIKLARDTKMYDLVKVPGFAAILGYLRKRYGKFETVYCMRDPRDCAASALERAKHGPEVAHIGLFWTPLSTGVADPFPAAGIARRWLEYRQAALKYEDENGGGVYWLHYEKFVRDKEAVLTHCARSVGLQFAAKKVAGELDIQFNKNLLPGQSRAIHGVGWWKNSLRPDEVRAIEDICGDAMKEEGYL
jgi:hypothetical protein